MIDYAYLRAIVYVYLPKDVAEKIGSRQRIFRHAIDEKYIKFDRDFQYLSLVAKITDAPEIIINVYMHSYAHEALFFWYYKEKYQILMKLE